MPLVSVAVGCAVLAVLAWVAILLKVGGIIKSAEDEGTTVVRLALSAAAPLFAIAASLMFHFIRKRTTLKTHLEALHLLYVFEKMPLTGASHLMYEMKVKRPQGKVIKYSRYSVYSDGSFREDEDPVCC